MFPSLQVDLDMNGASHTLNKLGGIKQNCYARDDSTPFNILLHIHHIHIMTYIHNIHNIPYEILMYNLFPAPLSPQLRKKKHIHFGVWDGTFTESGGFKFRRSGFRGFGGPDGLYPLGLWLEMVLFWLVASRRFLEFSPRMFGVS